MSLLWILSMHIWHWCQNWRRQHQGHYFRSIRTLTEQPRETADVFSRRLLFRKTTINTRRCLVLFLSWNITWTLLVGLEHVHGNILPVNWPCLWIGQDIRCSVHWSSHGIMGRRFPNGGLLRYRKWVPQPVGDVNKQGSWDSPPIGGELDSDNNNISQLLRDTFSVSQQPPIWEPPSHYSTS